MDAPKKIILVEDNLADVKLTKMAFGNLPMEVDITHFYNGQELLDYLATATLSEISLILLDLNMPKLGGLDVLTTFNSNPDYKKLPVVIFTSSVHQAEVRSCYELGANAYVNKPLDIADFDETIKAIAFFWISTNIMVEFSEV